MLKNDFDDNYIRSLLEKEDTKLFALISEECDLNYNFSKSFERKMKALIKTQNTSKLMLLIITFAKRTAIIAFALITLGFTATMSVEACRTNFLEIIIKKFKEFTSFSFIVDRNEKVKIFTPKYPKYVPEGFSLTKKTLNEKSTSVIYENVSGNQLIYLQRAIGNSQVIYDTENATEMQTIYTDNIAMHLYKNKGIYKIHWNDNHYTYSLTGKIDKANIIDMAISVLKK